MGDHCKGETTEEMWKDAEINHDNLEEITSQEEVSSISSCTQRI
jgi:hypothetical protein